MRIISMEEGGNMKRVFERWCDGLKVFEDSIRCVGKERGGGSEWERDCVNEWECKNS